MCFSVYYVLENALKIWSYGWKGYSLTTINILDGLVSFSFFLLQMIHTIYYQHPYVNDNEQFNFLTEESFSLWGLSRIFNVLLIFRLINLAPSVKVMYTILSTSVDIIRKLRPIFGIMIFIFYDYALFGMELFNGKIHLDSFDHYDTT